MVRSTWKKPTPLRTTGNRTLPRWRLLGLLAPTTDHLLLRLVYCQHAEEERKQEGGRSWRNPSVPTHPHGLHLLAPPSLLSLACRCDPSLHLCCFCYCSRSSVLSSLVCSSSPKGFPRLRDLWQACLPHTCSVCGSLHTLLLSRLSARALVGPQAPLQELADLQRRTRNWRSRRRSSREQEQALGMMDHEQRRCSP